MSYFESSYHPLSKLYSSNVTINNLFQESQNPSSYTHIIFQPIRQEILEDFKKYENKEELQSINNEEIGYIYLIQRDGAIARNEPIYKVGMAKDLSRRLKTGYDHGMELRYSRRVTNYKNVEKICIKKLKENFKLVQGRETFEGLLSDIIKCIDQITSQYATNK